MGNWWEVEPLIETVVGITVQNCAAKAVSMPTPNRDNRLLKPTIVLFASLLNKYQLPLAQKLIERCLEEIGYLPNSDSIHKGALYWNLGIAYFLADSDVQAIQSFETAYSEDIRNYGSHTVAFQFDDDL